MEKIKIYYNKEKDSMLMVKDGVNKFYDENISSTNFLSYFIDEEDISKLKELSVEDVLDSYSIIQADFEDYAGEEEQKEYYGNAKDAESTGELVFNK